METKLLPCAHCPDGGQPQLYRAASNWSNHFVRCMICGTMTILENNKPLSKEEAIEMWNAIY